jgi:hypothetical protein
MSDELAPVEIDEFVLRRIHRSHFTPGFPFPIQRVAFEPRRGESDGVSVYRERLVTPAQVAAAGRKPAHEYFVARLLVRDLCDLQLTVMPVPRPELPGHCVIPELNWETFQRDVCSSKIVQAKLAELASQTIVLPAQS